MPRHKITRRDFVAGTSQAALGAMVLPRHVLGGPGYQAPSDTLNVAIVGAGGMGMSNAEALVSQNIVALCDVDFEYVDKQLVGRDKNRQGEIRPDGVQLMEQFGKAARYTDFREMLAQERDLVEVLEDAHLRRDIPLNGKLPMGDRRTDLGQLLKHPCLVSRLDFSLIAVCDEGIDRREGGRQADLKPATGRKRPIGLAAFEFLV